MNGTEKTKTDDSNPESTHSSNSNSFVERILSPQALQRMMTCGGGLLVLGFVGWLWSIGVFENPTVVAVTMGGVTLAVLTLGIGMVRLTRHELAGTGLTLLASFALPLNLWFYNAQGLITIADGGHLWIPAAIICGVYALVARILRKPMFVYSLVAGVVMTGMLILADADINRFMELTGPVTMLVTAGWMFVFSERLFATGDGDFSRKKFGAAFHRSGIIVVSGGLLLLLGGQVAGWLNGIFFDLAQIPLVVTESIHKWWAIGIISISAIGFTVEHYSKRPQQDYMKLAILLAIWCGLCLSNLLAIHPQLPHVAILAGMLTVVSNLLAARKSREGGMTTQQAIHREKSSWLIASGLTGLSLIQFAMLFFATPEFWFMSVNHWLTGTQMFVAAVVVWSTGFRTDSLSFPVRVSAINLCNQVAGGMGILALFSIVPGFESPTIDLVALAGLSIPVLLSLMASRQEIPGRPGSLSPAVISVLVLLAGLLVMFGQGFGLLLGQWTWVWILTAAATVCFDMRATGQTNRLAGYLLWTAAVWQALSAVGLSTDYALPCAATMSGLGFAIVNALIRKVSGSPSRQDRAFETPANLLILIGSVSSVLLTLTRIMGSNIEVGFVVLLICQLFVTTVAGILSVQSEWRQTWRAISFALVLALLGACNSLTDMHWLHRAEVGSLVVGGTLMFIGHIGWFREGEKEDSIATLALWLGCAMIAIPIATGLLYFRIFDPGWQSGWVLFHEIGSIVAALSLFAMGVSCRIRSTTISGAGLLTVYILSLMTLVQWPDQLKSVSVVMMVGGGLFFAIAVLLSVYRDKISQLPKLAREKKGVFRVMRWR